VKENEGWMLVQEGRSTFYFFFPPLPTKGQSFVGRITRRTGQMGLLARAP
jgi:hypothetical protein